MRKKKIRLLLGALALVLVAGLVVGALTMKASANDAQASAGPDGAAIASQRLQEALGIAANGITGSASKPALPSADAVLQWSSGLADIDTSTGQILSVVQDRNPGVAGDPFPPFLDNSQLASIANHFVLLVGWDDAALAGSGFRPGSAGIVSQAMCEYRQTWDAFTSQGVRTDGTIEVRLDARDGRIESFFYNRGVGDTPTNVSMAISQSEAESTARATIQSYIAQQPNTGSDTSQTTAATVDLTLSSAVLKLTNAPALTDGATKLIWLVTLNGEDSTGLAVGGNVYIDALSGKVIQFLSF